MAEEEVVAVASPGPADLKRKLEDLEPVEAPPEPPQSTAQPDQEDSDESDPKRPRLEDKPDVPLANENGYEGQKLDEPKKEEEATEQPPAEEAPVTKNGEQPAEEAPVTENNEEPAVAAAGQAEGVQQLSNENAEEETLNGVSQEPVQELLPEGPQPGDITSGEDFSRKMQVPQNKVGVLIGKAGDTIRFLQLNSGARIQIMRDAEADPSAATRPVELIGSLESINKAERLIKDVIAEADAGGSPSLVARGFSTVQSSGAGEQIQIQVPNEKVGMIIGKGGETIKNLQTKSGARIQLIPQHLPDGDQSKERTVRVTGDKKQIEMARDMIKEVMNQPIRPSGGYNQQAFRPRGPAASQWGPRGHSAQSTGYDHQQRGYPSQSSQYPPPMYGGYPPQQLAPRSNFGWEQRAPPTAMHGPPQGGYDYYGGQGGPQSAPLSNPNHPHAGPSAAMGPPPSQANYNYGQPQGPEYGQPTPYPQTAPPQNYGHGYNETKYENQPAMQHPYGGHGGSQQPAYPQGTMHPGYGPQEQYGKPPYGMPPQGPHTQSYGQPRVNQPGDMPYQGPPSSTPLYGPNAPAQQSYPYAQSGPMQQTYPPYGSAPAADGYNQPPPAAAAAPVYPQQAGQPVAGYGQPGGQQAPGYAQVGPTGGYGAYPSSQPGYAEQAAPNNAGYGYQGPTDPAYGSGAGSAYVAPTTGQPAYTQPAQTPQGYDQSIPQSGGYGSVPAGYVKSVSPQPGYQQYDSTQVYGAHR
ncbi:hypothetical protein RJ640_020452 [Escallonia rubra]|uniref:K Homology domain-containing protein n=1 Tax=Escallonia rubra TaxID=112253 RepID=A0AA88R7P8_9ASTE|nr:hypothetical protein RJ640_020452 [Escallonia rubra]